jgi:hypothetical protein
MARGMLLSLTAGRSFDRPANPQSSKRPDALLINKAHKGSFQDERRAKYVYRNSEESVGQPVNWRFAGI